MASEGAARDAGVKLMVAAWGRALPRCWAAGLQHGQGQHGAAKHQAKKLAYAIAKFPARLRCCL